ncbi:MAG: hypothetical protein HYY55_04410 [Candidatus Niyogibacteria bacterium]|nr:MAG: hypothetical protein HYY55_04410 [Candidatus Niyogibacteria bacterium]
MSKLIITTAISGSRRKEYLQKFEERAKASGKKVKIYHVGQMMLEHSNHIGVNFTPENVLNAPPSVIGAVRSAVFERIAGELPKELKKNDVVFINIHAFFYWKNVFVRAWDNYYVSQLNPDMFLAFVDDVIGIDRELRRRKQWKKEKLTYNEILLWRNVDVEMTASWAEMKRKLFYVIPSQSNEKLLYRMIFEPHLEKIYIAMPLTHFMNPAGQKIVDNFIKKLEKYFVIFDPREVEMVEQWKPSMRTEEVLNQIVNRDMYWLIKQVDRVIAYFPKPVLSPGVINELREAHETNKEAWLVYPKGETMSPFLTYYSNMVFRGPDQLLKFLGEKDQAHDLPKSRKSAKTKKGSSKKRK